ncbi:A/G-specific adenine glycosylase [Paracidovorax sp. MALMAid1276]|uniref:A/G-specific adenine glycosylase n=1 Tax=Paracidovorax sp. MALMAid1276 TaxID=3411631 RepID=UPI003B99ED09
MTGASTGASTVSGRVVAWQQRHGRNHLPWQQTRDPYRVWLSEIMLQQTQVATVLDYYSRFLARFPDVIALSQASQDEVMGMWSGLGYYSRARNLHRCAQQVVSDHGGQFPPSAAALATLPGIGKSTAGAIAAFCFSERAPILDANVRRVLTRWMGFKHDLASAANERQLWDRACELLPHEDLVDAMPRYTQGMMDLGATLCTPRTPRCGECPLAQDCVARREGAQAQYPVRTRKLSRRSESWQLLVLRDSQGRIWLERRPASGIWAGLHCVPVFEEMEALHACVNGLDAGPSLQISELPPFVHVLTHRDLHLHTVAVSGHFRSLPTQGGEWVAPEQWSEIGLAAPIRKLLETTQSTLW